MPIYNPLQGWITGYPKLSKNMELQPEMAIFRRFGALGAQNLLYLQAELVWLEKRLQRRQIADSESGKGRTDKYALNWYRLAQSGEGDDNEQLKLVMKIRETLKEYSKSIFSAIQDCSLLHALDEALIQQNTILEFPEPDNLALTYLQRFLETKEMGPFALMGPDATIWGSCKEPKAHSPDLVALRPRPEESSLLDRLAESIITRLVGIGCAQSRKHGLIGFDDKSVIKIAHWMVNICASLILIASIVVLYCVHSAPGRLAIIATFNLLMSVCLSAFTNAKRSEAFAITAAYV